MFPHRCVRAAAFAGLLLLQARTAAAQTPVVHFGGSVQTQYSTASGDSTEVFDPDRVATSVFDVRRLRLVADVRIGETTTLMIVPSLEMGQLRMAYAWVRVLLAHDATSGIGLTMGQEKRPFNRYELMSSTTLPSIERGARLRGVANPVSQDNLLIFNGYASLDLGAAVDLYALDGRVAVKAGLYNGAGESAADVNNAKSWAVRATATVLRDGRGRPRLRIGASALSRDRAVVTAGSCAATCRFAPDSSHRSTAFGADIEWGDFRPGLHVIADASTGEALAPDGPWTYSTGHNTANLLPGAPDSAFTRFGALQAVASWRWLVRGRRTRTLVYAVEPALRVDVTDPDVDRPATAGLLVTPALNVHFTPTTLVRAGYDWYRYHDAAGATHSVGAVRYRGRRTSER